MKRGHLTSAQQMESLLGRLMRRELLYTGCGLACSLTLACVRFVLSSILYCSLVMLLLTGDCRRCPLGYYTMTSVLSFLKRGQSKKKPMEDLSLCRLLFAISRRARCRESSAHRSHGLAAWPQSMMEDRSNQQFLGGGGQYQARVWLLCMLEW